MIRVLALFIILISASVSASESVAVITADEWARPRSGASLVQMPALKRTVRDYLRMQGDAQNSAQDDTQGNTQSGQRILIHHPRGEEGVLWAEELRGWLVALGVPSTDIELSADSTRIDAIELEVKSADN